MRELVEAPICVSCRNYLKSEDNKIFYCSECEGMFKFGQPQNPLCDICNFNKYFHFSDFLSRRGITIFCSNPKCPSYDLIVANYPGYKFIRLLYGHMNLMECILNEKRIVYWYDLALGQPVEPPSWICQFFFDILDYHKYIVYKQKGGEYNIRKTT